MNFIKLLESERACAGRMSKLYNPFFFEGKETGLQVAINIIKQYGGWISVMEYLPDKFWDDGKKYYCRVVARGEITYQILVWRWGEWRNVDFSPLGEKGFTAMPYVTHYFELPREVRIDEPSD